jgi:hypothetical protein
VKTKHASLLASFALSIAAPASAQESTLVAGWDFAQYAIAGFLSLDGATLTNTLDANHSDLDETNGSGIESNGFGTLHMDGLFGSTSTPLSFEGLDPFQPADVPPNGSLVSNAEQAFLGFGSQSGTAACNQQQLEQMPGANCTNVAMVAIDATSVVFEADRGDEPLSGTWLVSFAAKTLVEGAASVSVQWSADGGGYTNAGTAQLTSTDTAFTFELGAPSSETMFVRLGLPAQEPGTEAVIDNLGIAVPEPDAAGLALAAFAVLAATSRARR